MNEALFAAAESSPLVLAVKAVSGQEVEATKFAVKRGDTPLMAAARNGETDVVRVLLEKKAKIGVTNHGGETARNAAACVCAERSGGLAHATP